MQPTGNRPVRLSPEINVFCRAVPQHKLRAMFLTGSMITAQELLAFGTVERVVPRERL